jgi:membrane protein required for beta-lactamase induction
MRLVSRFSASTHLISLLKLGSLCPHLQFFKIIFYLFIYLCLYVFVCMCVGRGGGGVHVHVMMHMWMSEDNLEEKVLSFHCMESNPALEEGTFTH